MKALIAVVILNLLSTAALAASVEPASPSKLHQITIRGKALAEYDEACGKASNAVAALAHGDIVRRVFARKRMGQWQIVFGRRTRDGGRFVIDYEASWKPGAAKATATQLVPPRIDMGDWLHWAKAIDTALPQFKSSNKTNNYAIFPFNNSFWVYIYAQSTEPGTWLLGGDMRFIVSADGSKILESRYLHRTILPYSASPDGKETVMGYHSAVLDNVPEDTDVFHVLSRRPAVPELVVAREFVYKIYPDGVIKYVGPSSDLDKGKLNIDD